MCASVTYRPAGSVSTKAGGETSTGPATGIPASTVSSAAMSITLYRKKGGPATAIPRSPSHPNIVGR